MAAKVFLCYRRDDSAAFTGRVQDRLVQEFGRDLLFMDVDAIPLGVNFVTALHEAVAECEVLLAVIGPNWLEARDDARARRLDDPDDFVRIEIGAALQRNIPVIPILQGGAKVPRTNQLPEDLKELPLRNGLDVRNSSFHSDLEPLVQGLKTKLGQDDAEKRRREAEPEREREQRSAVESPPRRPRGPSLPRDKHEVIQHKMPPERHEMTPFQLLSTSGRYSTRWPRAGGFCCCVGSPPSF
jgi:hypothetical protein